MSEGEFSAEEARSLPTHVAVCRERYKAFHEKLTRGDKRMGRIERMLWGIIVFLLLVNFPAAKEFVGILL